MTQGKAYNKDTFATKDVLVHLTDGFAQATVLIEKANAGMRETVTLSDKLLKKSININAAKDLKDYETELKKVNIAMTEAIKLDADKINAETKLAKATRLSAMEAERTVKAKERSVVATERAIKAEENLSSIYSKVDKKLAGLTREYRDLAIRKRLHDNLNHQELKRYLHLEKQIGRYDSALKMTDTSMGKHQREVGNYKKGFDGLGSSFMQLTREAPAFANSINTGFMAISNNLPMFVDELNKLKEANIELAKSGQPTKSVLKSVGAAIFSFQTLLSVGVTMLTLYGGKLIESIFANKSAEESEKRKADAIKNSNEQINKASEFIGKEAAQMVGYLMQLKATNSGSKERSKLIEDINKQYGTTLQNLSDEADFQSMVNTEVKKYIQFQRTKYQIQKNDELIQRNIENQNKLSLQTLDKLNGTQNSRIKQLKEEIRLSELRGETVFKSTRKELKTLEEQEKFNKKREQIEGRRIYTQKQLDEMVQNSAVVMAGLAGRTDSASIALMEYITVTEQANKRLENYGVNLLNANIEADSYGKYTKENTKKTKELNTSLDDLNLAFKDNRDVLFEINQLLFERRATDAAKDVEAEMRTQIKNIEDGNKLETDLLDKLIGYEADIREAAVKHQFDFETEMLKKQLDEEIKMRTEAAEKNRDSLLSQDGLTPEARDKINDDYKKKIQELADYRINQTEVMKSTIEKMEIQLAIDLGKIEDEKFEKVKDKNDELIDLQIKTNEEKNKITKDGKERDKKDGEEKKKNDKANFDQSKKYIDDLINLEIKAHENRIAQLDKERDAAQKHFDYLQQLAVNGNIKAEDSLKKAAADINEANKKKIEEQQKIERLKLLEVEINLLLKNLETETSTGKAIAKTTIETAAIELLFAKAKGFSEGTVTDFKSELGKSKRPGIDGHLVRVDDDEKLLSIKDSKKTGDYTTKKIADVAYQHRMGNLIHIDDAKAFNQPPQYAFYSMQKVEQGIDKLIEITKNKPVYPPSTFEQTDAYFKATTSMIQGNKKVVNVKTLFKK